MLTSVDDEVAIRNIHPAPAYIKPMIETLRADRLSTFANVRHAYGTTVAASDIVASEDHCPLHALGGIVRIVPVAKSQDSFAVEGWSFDQNAQRSFSSVLILSNDYVVRGFASSTKTLSNLPLKLTRSQEHNVGWVGYRTRHERRVPFGIWSYSGQWPALPAWDICVAEPKLTDAFRPEDRVLWSIKFFDNWFGACPAGSASQPNDQSQGCI